jgi:hypothetical protein
MPNLKMDQIMHIQRDLFLVKPIPNGFTFSLASRLGDMIRRAEQIFGPRDTSFTPLGVEFRDTPPPQIWFPGNCRHIVIQLTADCSTNVVEACYQLAHEAVHLLAPTGGAFPANVLEEGCATDFAAKYVAEHFHFAIQPGKATYDLACQKARALLALDATIVRRIREKQPAFHLMTKEHILEACDKVPEELAVALIEKFAA